MNFYLALDGFAGGQTGGGRSALGTLLADITKIFTAIMGWAKDVASVVAENPLLLLIVVIPIACVGVGLFKRLIRL